MEANRMRITNNICLVAGCVIVVFAVSMYMFCGARAEKTITFPFELVWDADGVSVELKLYCDDMKMYTFLPAGAELTDIHFVDVKGEVSIGGVQIETDKKLSDYEVNRWYALLESNGTKYEWIIRQSENVATMFVDTYSGTMDHVHQTKGNEEYCKVYTFNQYGDNELCRESLDVIKGHGNSSWYRDKKSYGIHLQDDLPLLGMPPAQKWVLRASATDETSLINKVIYDFSEKLFDTWSPHCEYVQLYLNGEYNGLYLLTEQIEFSDSRLQVYDMKKAFIANICPIHQRDDSKREYYDTNRGKGIEIVYPAKYVATNHRQMIQRMEDKLLFDAENDLLVDLDSFCKKYLIDEVFANSDADIASSYYYYDGGESKIYAGPIWDYDASFGLFPFDRDPISFHANTSIRYMNEYEKESLYYPHIYDKKEFRRELKKIFENEVEELYAIVVQMDVIAKQISASNEMNYIRWKEMYDNNLVEFELERWDKVYLQEWLQKRLDFLSAVWIDEEEIYSVQFEMDTNKSVMLSVYKGQSIGEDRIRFVDNLCGTFLSCWKDAGGRMFDVGQPVEKDMVLFAQYEGGENERESSNQEQDVGFMGGHGKMLMVLFSLSVLGIVFLRVVIAERKVHRRE